MPVTSWFVTGRFVVDHISGERQGNSSTPPSHFLLHFFSPALYVQDAQSLLQKMPEDQVECCRNGFPGSIHAVSKLQRGRGVLRLSVSPFSGFLNWCLFILFIYFGHTLQHAGSLSVDQGLNPGPLCWEQGVLTTGHQGSPSDFLFLKDQVSRPRWSRYTSLYSSYKVQIETLELTCNFIYKFTFNNKYIKIFNIHFPS